MKQVPVSRTVVAAALGGVAWFASLGVNNVWPLAWLVPLPILLIAPDLSARHAAMLASATALIGSLNLIIAYQNLPVAVVVGIVLGIALHFTAVVLIWRFVARRAGALMAAWSYPLILITTEYLISLASPHGTAGNSAYSQGDVLQLIQLASVTGLWGIGFLLALVPSAIAAAWRQRQRPPVARRMLLSAAVPLIAALAFGMLRLRDTQSAEPIRLGLLANDKLLPKFESTTVEEILPVVREMVNGIESLAAQGASVVVLPEKFFGVGVTSSDSVQVLLQKAATRSEVTLVAGLNKKGTEGLTNVAAVFTPTGAPIATYIKRHLVPGLEAEYEVGSADYIFAHEEVLVGVAICKDIDFQSLGLGYARAGVGLMILPAWDFGADAWVHSRMAIVRAVEGGYALARTASEGRLTVSDAKGRVVAEKVTNSTDLVELYAMVRPGTARTLYSRFGDVFAWLCVAGAAFVIGRAAASRHRAS